MIKINLFLTFEEMDKFVLEHQQNGNQFYIIKFVVSYNPFTRTREFYIWWSGDDRMKQGMHIRNGGQR